MSFDHGMVEEAVRDAVWFVATKDFVCWLDGERVEVKAGLDRRRGSHELVRNNPDCFEVTR